MPPKGVAPVVPVNASSPVNFSPVIYPSSAIPQTDRPGFTPRTGSASNGTPTQTVTVDLTTTLPLTTPLTAPVTAPITTPLPFAAEQTAPEPDPELKDLITKLTAEENAQLIIQVTNNMKAKLIDDNVIAVANESAKTVVAELLSATVHSIDPEFTVVVVQ